MNDPVDDDSTAEFSATEMSAEDQYNLGAQYYSGQGVPQDYQAAVKWFRLAAEQGHPEAQFFLGQMYSLGQGVAQNYTECMKWVRLAADQGDAEAQYNIGGTNKIYRARLIKGLFDSADSPQPTATEPPACRSGSSTVLFGLRIFAVSAMK